MLVALSLIPAKRCD